MRHSAKHQPIQGLDELELAKLRAQEAAVTAFKKSIRWFIISFFIIIALGSCFLWIRSFHL